MWVDLVNNCWRLHIRTAPPNTLPPPPHIPRRSLLYVPGDDTRKLRKAAQLRCDFIALDCEDGVAVSRKQEARNTIRAFYDSNLNEVPSKFDRNQRQSEWSVRLNGWSSGLCEDDLRVVVAGRRVPETLLLPKCESAAELQAVSGGCGYCSYHRRRTRKGVEDESHQMGGVPLFRRHFGQSSSNNTL